MRSNTKQNKRFVIVRVEVRAGANWDGHQVVDMRNMYESQRGKRIELDPYSVGHLPLMCTTTAALK